MATSTQDWIDELKSISVLELSERIKALEEAFGVSAAAMSRRRPPPAGRRRRRGRGRRGADGVRRRPHRPPATRRSRSSRSSARPPAWASRRPRRSSTRPRSPSRRASTRTRPRSSRPTSKRPAAPSRSSSSREGTLRCSRAPAGRPGNTSGESGRGPARQRPHSVPERCPVAALARAPTQKGRPSGRPFHVPSRVPRAVMTVPELRRLGPTGGGDGPLPGEARRGCSDCPED